MIISRTPLRVSFAGGGTDLPCFYMREQGAVISITVDKYVYITVNRRFDDTLRISYSQTEIVDGVDSVRHPLFRETMRYTGAVSGLEITSISHVPAGTGLGSSSSFTVGLLHALGAFQQRYMSAVELAEAACHVELDILGEPIGKQDQYAAAFGGLRRYRFNPDGSVFVDPVICSPETKAKLFKHLMFFYLGGTRDAREVLRRQSDGIAANILCLRRIRAAVDEFWSVLVSGNGISGLGDVLHETWQYKKQLADNVSNGTVDQVYERARQAGAAGGKLLGAGAGGFLMLFCAPRHQAAVREALHDLREVTLGFAPEGSKIVYVEN